MENEADYGDEVVVNADLLVSEYGTFINEIFKRLDAVSESLSEIKANPNHPDNWKNCDFCWFQIRKVCEYLALAIVLAHHRDTDAVNDLSKWRPSDLLKQVDKLNAHPTPVQISNQLFVNQEGGRQITPLSKPVGLKIISGIYGKCNDLLHVGKLDRILKAGLPAYDISQLQSWRDGFEGLLRNHILMLPQIKRILLCWHEIGEAKQPQIFLVEGESEGVFVMDNLPEFKLLAA
jgi:hypothetical protein